MTIESTSRVIRMMLKKLQKNFQDSLWRISHWRRVTGLLPPELRGFAPAMEGDECPAMIDKEYDKRINCRAEEEERELEPGSRHRYVGDWQKPYPHKPTWALPSRSPNNDPSWDNAIRAYEEDR